MPPLSNEDRCTLLQRARQAIVEAVLHRRIPDFPPKAGRLAEPGGAFVTLFCGGRLQGCIGRVDRSSSLAETVAQCAISAALHDQRFPPLGKHQIELLRIEISVLSELFPVSAQAIEAGTHGLVVTRGTRRGLLLPQVAVERRWSVERFLEETCRKAGMEPGAWQDPQTSLFAFTAEVFGETDVRNL
jgi:AmmeMemoRadiSam system protein A